MRLVIIALTLISSFSLAGGIDGLVPPGFCKATFDLVSLLLLPNSNEPHQVFFQTAVRFRVGQLVELQGLTQKIERSAGQEKKDLERKFEIVKNGVPAIFYLDLINQTKQRLAEIDLIVKNEDLFIPEMAGLAHTVSVEIRENMNKSGFARKVDRFDRLASFPEALGAKISQTEMVELFYSVRSIHAAVSRNSSPHFSLRDFPRTARGVYPVSELFEDAINDAQNEARLIRSENHILLQNRGFSSVEIENLEKLGFMITGF